MRLFPGPKSSIRQEPSVPLMQVYHSNWWWLYNICNDFNSLFFSIFLKGLEVEASFETKKSIIKNSTSMDIEIAELTPGSSYKIEFSIGLYEGKKFQWFSDKLNMARQHYSLSHNYEKQTLLPISASPIWKFNSNLKKVCPVWKSISNMDPAEWCNVHVFNLTTW